jgi:tRNA threonylcarbamoyladenosine biosynthesis protein TsaB
MSPKTKKPTILCVDTSTQTITVAICRGKEVLVDRSEPANQHHSKRLLRLIDECLNEANLKLSDVDAFVSTNGPGSFTGVRTSLGTLKALSFSKQKPLMVIPTLLAMAYPCSDDMVVPVLDARRDFVYVGQFQRINNQWIEQIDPCMIPTAELHSHIPANAKTIGHQTGNSEFDHIHGRTLCAIAYQKYMNNEFEDVFTTEPLYIQKTAAEGYV